MSPPPPRIERADVMQFLRSLPDASVDALVTDPPYSSGGFMRSDRMQQAHSKYVQTGSSSHELYGFSGDNRDQRSFLTWCALWLAEAQRVLKPGALVMLFTDWRQLPVTSDALQVGGLIWRGVVTWVKPGARPMATGFSYSTEFVVWGSNGPRDNDYSAPCPPGHWVGSSPRDRDHITQKPEKLLRHLLQLVPKGGVVCDPFCGSGTTGVAAVNLGLGFVGADHDQHWVDHTRERIASARYEAIEQLPLGEGAA